MSDTGLSPENLTSDKERRSILQGVLFAFEQMSDRDNSLEFMARGAQAINKAKHILGGGVAGSASQAGSRCVRSFTGSTPITSLPDLFPETGRRHIRHGDHRTDVARLLQNVADLIGAEVAAALRHTRHCDSLRTVGPCPDPR